MEIDPCTITALPGLAPGRPAVLIGVILLFPQIGRAALINTAAKGGLVEHQRHGPPTRPRCVLSRPPGSLATLAGPVLPLWHGSRRGPCCTAAPAAAIGLAESATRGVDTVFD
jgi:hypothetical protein